MSQINRLTVSRGPALVTFRGGSFLSAGDMVVELKHDSFAVPSDAYGKLDDVQLGVKASLKFKPVGEFEHLAVLWPYASTVPGTTIFGTDADYPLVIKPLDDTQDMVTFHAAGVSKMPDLNFTAKETLMGDVEFQMIGQNDTLTTAANRLFTFAANDITTVPYDPAALLIQGYTNRWFSAATFTLTFGANTTTALAWDASAADIQTAFRALASCIALNVDPTVTGSLDSTDGLTITFGNADGNVGQTTCTLSNAPSGSVLTASTTTAGSTGVTAEVQKIVLTSPWLSFEAREGVKVAFAMQTTEDESDAIGHYDTIFSGLDVTAKALPQGIALATILDAARVQGSTSVRGRRFGTGSHALRVSADGVYFLLYGAQLDGAGMIRSSKTQAVPELTWKGTRSVAAGGTINPLFYIGTGAP